MPGPSGVPANGAWAEGDSAGGCTGGGLWRVYCGGCGVRGHTTLLGALTVENDLYESLKQIVNEAEDDWRKAAGGNKAAGTRVRQTMQRVKDAAQEIRKAVLEMRDKQQPTS